MTLYSNYTLDELRYNGTPIASLIVSGILSKTAGSYAYATDDLAEWMGTPLSTLILFGKFTAGATPAINCIKFTGPTESFTTSIGAGISEDDYSFFYRNPAWDDVKVSTPMFAWALPKGALYTDTREPVVGSTHVWAKSEGEWVDLSALEETPVTIFDLGHDSFDSLNLRAGANVEVSDNGTTWTAWTPDNYMIEASVDDEGQTIDTFGERWPDGDQTISETTYYCWIGKPYDMFTLSETPSAGATVYSIEEGVVASAGSVTKLSANGYSHPVVNGVVYVRAKTGSTPLYGFSGLYYKVEGPVMSLVDYDNVSTCVLADHQFARTIYYGGYSEAGLFYDETYTFLDNSSSPFLSDASGLIMPGEEQVAATSSYALSMMFNNCLTIQGNKLPTLTTPAIAQGIYDCFAFGCISITELPEGYLDDTFTSTPGAANYSFMFSQCVSLRSIPDGFLDTNNLGGVFWSENYWGYQSAYTEMFSNCYSLETVPEDLLPATTLTPCCYGHMFMNCVSLTNAPVLDAQTLASGCYKGMFEGCSSLTEAPELPATLLPSEVVMETVDSPRGCYQRMFMGCSGIEDAPALTALTLQPYSYSEMFEDCSVLSNVTCLATDITAYQSTASWLSGVAESGSFHRNSSQWAYWQLNSPSGIPEGWTIDPEPGNINLKVYYPYQGTSTSLAFVRYPYGDEIVDTTHYYAWAIADADFDTIFTTTLTPTVASTLYYKDGESFVQSSANIEPGVFTSKVSIVIQNYASGVPSNSIHYTITEGSYTNSAQAFTGATTSDATVTVTVSGSNWKWSDDETTTSPRTFDVPLEGLFAVIDPIE